MKDKKILIVIGIIAVLVIAIATTILLIDSVNKKNAGIDEEIKFESENQEINEGYENKYSQVDWSNLEFNMNGKQYKYPFKVLDFVNNGWLAQSSDFEYILNNTINDSISKGYNYITLKQDNLIMNLYFDTNIIDAKVVDTNAIYFEIEKTNDNNSQDDLNFYGIKFGSTNQEIINLFGTKNYSETEDEKYLYYNYLGKTADSVNTALRFDVDKNTNKLIRFSISLY